MSASLYHSSTGTQAPHCMHVVGVGRTGAAYVEALRAASLALRASISA